MTILKTCNNITIAHPDIFSQGSKSTYEILPPTYVPVASMQAINTRPVVILGDLKHNISEDLLSEFPDYFGTCVPREPHYSHFES